MASPRKRAFRRPNDPDWIPKHREQVWIRGIRGTPGNLVATGWIYNSTFDPDYFRVVCYYGQKRMSRLWHINDLRPMKKTKQKVGE